MATKKDKTAALVPQKDALPPSKDLMSDMAGDAGKGHEGITSADTALPFMALAQGLSPQLKPRDGKFINGLRQGDIFNSLTKDIFKGEIGILVIPVAHQFKHVEWVPREKGGGLVTQYDRGYLPTDVRRDEVLGQVRPNGNQVRDTSYFYCLQVTGEDEATPVIISMSGIALKKAKRWNSLITGIQIKGPSGFFRPPIYSHQYQLTSVPEKSIKGDNFNWDPMCKGMISSRILYNTAKSLSDMVRQGLVQAKPIHDEDDEPSDNKKDVM